MPIPPTIPPHLRHGMPSTSIAAGLAAAAAGMVSRSGGGFDGHLGRIPGLGVGLPAPVVPNFLAQSYHNSIHSMNKVRMLLYLKEKVILSLQ